MKNTLLEHAVSIFAWVGLITTTVASVMLCVWLFPWLYAQCFRWFTPRGIYHSTRILITSALSGKRWDYWCGYQVGLTLREIREESPELFATIMGTLNEEQPT